MSQAVRAVEGGLTVSGWQLDCTRELTSVVDDALVVARGTKGENADDSASLEQNTLFSLLVSLTVLSVSSSMHPLDENLVVILEDAEEEEGVGTGLELMPSNRRIASPTQSLHFC